MVDVISKTEYHPLVEKARRELWGKVGLVRDEDLDVWQTLGQDNKARYLAARVRCPLVETLLADSRFGPDYLVYRYGSVASFFSVLKNDLKPELREQFGAEVDLTSLGGIRRHDEEWVPEDKKMAIGGVETYYGYTVPRQVIDLLHTAKTPEEALDVLIVAEGKIASSSSLDDAVARLARLSLDRGICFEDVLGRMMPTDYEEEVPSAYVQPFFARVTAWMISTDSSAG